MQQYTAGFGKESEHKEEFLAFIERTKDVQSGKIESDK